MSKSPSHPANKSNLRSPSFSEINQTSTTSRTQTHEATTTSVVVEHNSPASLPTFVHPSTPEPIAGPSRTRPREVNTPSEQPMAKRFRAGPLGTIQSDRSSPSSDSQGGMADTEDGGHRSERSPAPSAPPKKKRTRTLTTPHQSSVLHALLAQSRFPTTAMREEVGRAIGLSARKVQIWFQNQRQKARRPRTHNEMPMTRPPQYGPFPSGGDSEVLNLYPRSQQSGTAHSESHMHPSYSPTFSGYPAPSSLPSGLLGPGVPGHGDSGRQQQGSLSPVSPTTGVAPSRIRRHDFLRRSPSPATSYEGPQLFRPATSYVSMSTMPNRDASRTLPPLVFPPQPREGSSGALPSIRPAPANVPPPSPFQSAHSPPSALSPPPVSLESVNRPFTTTTASLPPPFTLEPQPQWSDPIFTSIPHTASSSTWSMTSSERGRSLSPIVSRIPRGPLVHDQPSREGRYDPVRSTVVQYRPQESPSASDKEKE
jgi:hypothetical protein